ncbi:MAG: sulfatase [Planctomycetota bacterium]|nr:sulfatase [Planctomycetota bacterium]
MKLHMRFVMALMLIMPLAASVCSASEKPNIIFMLSDDQGWNGLSVAMHPEVAASKGDIFYTPNLEKLAAQGMRFSSAYAPSPVCSPTRISLQTGKSPAQLHWTKAAPAVPGRMLTEPRLIKDLSRDETTVGELLKKAGYTTAHYGKWHIAGGGPGAHGYDENDGDTGNENAFKFTDPNPVDIFGMAERAAKFMEKSKTANKPFYIQLSWNALHAPELAMKATQAKYEKLTSGNNSKQVATAAITEDLDSGVGKVLEAVERLGLSGNTYVIYMSDNGSGGGAKRGGLSGGKGSVWEGGIRVPLIVRGPGVAPNSWCNVPVVGYDFLPTFCAMGGLAEKELPNGIEGGNISVLLKNEGKGIVKRAREELVFHFPHYQSDDGPHSAIRLGDLKLIHFYENDRVSLFDLSKDIGERNDLAKQMPGEAKMLSDRLEKYLIDVKAQMPTKNTEFDPAKPIAPRKGGKGGDKNDKGNGKGAKKGSSKE